MQEKNEKHEKFLYGIPLDRCEVIADSVKTLTYGDIYEYQSASFSFTATHYFPITIGSIEAAMDAGMFDENGIFRQASDLPEDGSDGYIAVIKQNENNTFTGMVYKVPGQLILETMK